MRDFIGNIWMFKTARFAVTVSAAYDSDLDLSFDDTGEVRERLESGEFIGFWVKASVTLDGAEIACDTLGGCIYAEIAEFRDHLGRNAKGHGSYFSDMVHEAVREARKAIARLQSIEMREVA